MKRGLQALCVIGSMAIGGQAVAEPFAGAASEPPAGGGTAPRCGKACEDYREGLTLYSFAPQLDASKGVINPEPFDDEAMVAEPPTIDAPMPVTPPNGEE